MTPIPPELIPPREALKILTWVSESGLRVGAMRTNELTKFPCGRHTLYAREECERLRDSILVSGISPDRTPKWRKRKPRSALTELV